MLPLIALQRWGLRPSLTADVRRYSGLQDYEMEAGSNSCICSASHVKNDALQGHANA